MITGFNTDVSYGGTTYHVQTEDKGDDNPIILSLVYVRGAILAAKRTSYAKELEEGLSEQQLQSMLEKQHRTILAVIKAGRIQELVDKLNKQKASEEETHIEEAPKNFNFPTPPIIPVPQIPTVTPELPNIEKSVASVSSADFISTPPIQPTQPVQSVQSVQPVSQFKTLAFSSDLIERPKKSDTQPLVAEFDLDKIIFDYLQTDAQEEKIEINLKGAKDFYAGDSVVLQIELSRAGVKHLANLPVIVKVIGTAFKPLIYSGRTGPDGVAIMPVSLPNFTAGSAAIVIQSSSELGEAEIKHLIRRR